MHITLEKFELKGVKKNVYSYKNGYYSVHFLQHIHLTLITGSGILSGFQIILQHFSKTCSFWEMLKNAPKGRFKNCKKNKNNLSTYVI